MSQLVALIIAIALGAIVTAIGFVFLGDAFTKNSERGVALQFVSQASQIEIALTAYRAENAKSAFNTNYDLTLINSGDGLIDLGYLKDKIIAPQGNYKLFKDPNSSSLYFVSSESSATGNFISINVCQEIEKLSGREGEISDFFSFNAKNSNLYVEDLISRLNAGWVGNDFYACFNDFTGDPSNPTPLFIYKVQ